MVESATFYRTSKIVLLILPLLSCMFDFSEVKNTVHMLNVFIMHFEDNVTSNFQQNLGPITVPHFLKAEAIRTTVVPIRILIRTTVVPIRILIGTTVVRIRILIGTTGIFDFLLSLIMLFFSFS